MGEQTNREPFQAFVCPEHGLLSYVHIVGDLRMCPIAVNLEGDTCGELVAGPITLAIVSDGSTAANPEAAA